MASMVHQLSLTWLAAMLTCQVQATPVPVSYGSRTPRQPPRAALPPPRLSESQAHHLFPLMDANNDGKLSLQELQSFSLNTTRRAAHKHFRIPPRLDADKDGTLSLQELESDIKTIQESHNESNGEKKNNLTLQQDMFKTADANKDGKLTSDELISFFHPKLDHELWLLQVRPVFDSMDVDSDGKLSPTEFQPSSDFRGADEDGNGFIGVKEFHSWTSGLQKVTRALQELLTTADKDADGFVSLEELLAARASLRGTPASWHLLKWAAEHGARHPPLRPRATRRLPPQMLSTAQAHYLFPLVDGNNDGNISLEELQSFSLNASKRAAQRDLRIPMQLDADNDGSLSLQELEADIRQIQESRKESPEEQKAGLALQKAKFEKADTDKNGKLTGEELIGFLNPKLDHELWLLQARPMFESLDSDGDGKLTPAEFRPSRDFKGADADENGSISLQEFHAWTSGLRKVKRALQELLTIADRDADSLVSLEELLAARASLRGTQASWHLLRWAVQHGARQPHKRPRAAWRRPPQKLSKAQAHYLFPLIDTNKDGNISVEELQSFSLNERKRAAQRDLRIPMQFDADNDGSLSLQELEADIRQIQESLKESPGEQEAGLALQKAKFEKADTDKDGKLTGEELIGFLNPKLDHELWLLHARPLFESLDADGDGKLTPAEFRPSRDFKGADADENGSISLEEFHAWTSGLQKVKQVLQELPIFADENSDGLVSLEELLAARESLRGTPASWHLLSWAAEHDAGESPARHRAARPPPSHKLSNAQVHYLFALLDADGDGATSLDELETFSLDTARRVAQKGFRMPTRLDADRDGALSLQELETDIKKTRESRKESPGEQKARLTLEQEKFKIADSNLDGKLTGEELISFFNPQLDHKLWLVQVQPMFESGDVDSDGRLSLSEFGRVERSEGARAREDFMRADVDEDGSVSLTEFHAWTSGLRELSGDMNKLLKVADGDSDGRASLKELLAAREALSKTRASMHLHHWAAQHEEL